MTTSTATALPVFSPRNGFREFTSDDRKAAAVGLLLMFANAYYKLLECAVRAPCADLDMKFNQSYLWVLRHMRHLLLKHQDLADFPVQFRPVFADLLPSTIRDVDWEDVVAPEAERFISAIQMYAVDHGIKEPEEGSPAWIFLGRFRPGIEAAIHDGLQYRRRMEIEHHRKQKRASRDKEAPIHEAIKKNTDLIPSLMDKVDRTPQKTVAMLSGATKKRMKAAGAAVEENFTASQQYKNINWQGRQYTLLPNSAKIVEALHDAHRSLGLPSLHHEEIFSRAFGSNKNNWPSLNPRVQNFFRTGDAKRLWDDGFIKHDSKGNFWLKLGKAK